MRRGPVGKAVLSGTALLGLALCSPGCSSGDRGRTAGPPTLASSSVEPATRARRAESVVSPEAPVAVTLPSGAVVRIRPAATSGEELEVPADTRIAAWWKGGSRVGDPFGSTLVAAHVDSPAQGLGPFAELLGIDRGDRVVLDSAHLTQHFTVDSLRLLPQGPLSDEEWLFEATGPHRLTLVTCAPPYDRDRGGYQNLAVVTARPVSAPTRGGSR